MNVEYFRVESMCVIFYYSFYAIVLPAIDE